MAALKWLLVLLSLISNPAFEVSIVNSKPVILEYDMYQPSLTVQHTGYQPYSTDYPTDIQPTHVTMIQPHTNSTLSLMPSVNVTLPHISSDITLFDDNMTTTDSYSTDNTTLTRHKRQTLDLQETYSSVPFGTVFVPKAKHAFTKTIPFLDAFKQIVNIRLSVHEMDPDMSSNMFTPFESNGNKYFKSNALKTGSQN
jgi:hypothetical protein